MEALSKVLLLTGTLVTIAGAGMGAYFLLQDDFVIGRVSCVPADNPLGAPNCNEDNFVLDTSGDLCQIGNLGLFTSDFTPECTYDTAYAISAFVDPFSGDPVEFGPLFPAQTDLAGVLEDITSEEVEFEDCDQYFADLNAIDDIWESVVEASVRAGVDALRSTLIDVYAAVVLQVVDGTDDFFIDLAANLVAAINATFSGGLTSEYTDSFLGSNFTIFETLGAVENNTLVELAAGAIQLAIDNGPGVGFTSTDLVEAIDFGFALGTGALSLSGGVADEGMWSDFNSGALCFGVLSSLSCTYIEFFVQVTLLPEVQALNPFLATLNAFWNGTEAGILETFADITSVAELEALVASQTGLGLLLGKTTIATTIASNLNEDDAIPETFTIPYEDIPESEEFALLCLLTGVGACSFEDVLDFLIDPNAEGNTASALEIAQLSQLNDAFDGCVNQSAITLTFCFFGIGTDDSNQILGIAGSLGVLYGIDDATSVSDFLEASVEACKDDEKDKAAIQAAQQLGPAGVALSFIAVIATLGVMIVSKGRTKKILGITGGLVGLIGGFLFLAALLGVYNAPIYESVGGNDDPVDGDNVFLAGPATIFALAGIGCSIAGPVLLILGFVCASSPPSDELAVK